MQRLSTVGSHLSPVPAMAAAKSPITTHILDTARGRPAANVPIALFRLDGATWKQIGAGATNADGRCPNLMSEPLTAGRFRIEFDTEHYFNSLHTTGFYPYVHIVFDIRSPTEHYHVPLLLSDYSYSTYRGS
eukprot:m.53380 g.53380  ORF g.53380 m.53380 type:complete len:132 (+) comp11823_c0_seq1:1170-1565(+)